MRVNHANVVSTSPLLWDSIETSGCLSMNNPGHFPFTRFRLRHRPSAAEWQIQGSCHPALCLRIRAESRAARRLPWLRPRVPRDQARPFRWRQGDSASVCSWQIRARPWRLARLRSVSSPGDGLRSDRFAALLEDDAVTTRAMPRNKGPRPLPYTFPRRAGLLTDYAAVLE
jgi:hypothetical protein